MGNVTLPAYTKTEETFNWISHACGAALGLLFGAVLLGRADSVAEQLAAVIFGAACCWLYVGSALYHGARSERTKKVLRVVDHSSVNLLISGTCVPFFLTAVYPHYPKIALTCVVLNLLLGSTGVLLAFLALDKTGKARMAIYMVLGWTSIGLLYPLWKFAPHRLAVIGLLLGGGVVYTVGTAFLKRGKTRPGCHAIFHVMCLVGTAMHFASLFLLM